MNRYRQHRMLRNTARLAWLRSRYNGYGFNPLVPFEMSTSRLVSPPAANTARSVLGTWGASATKTTSPGQTAEYTRPTAGGGGGRSEPPFGPCLVSPWRTPASCGAADVNKAHAVRGGVAVTLARTKRYPEGQRHDTVRRLVKLTVRRTSKLWTRQPIAGGSPVRTGVYVGAVADVSSSRCQRGPRVHPRRHFLSANVTGLQHVRQYIGGRGSANKKPSVTGARVVACKGSKAIPE